MPKKKDLIEVNERGTFTLPKKYRRADLYSISLLEDGSVVLKPQQTIDALQSWFWTERWQKMEREADADIAAGRIASFESAEDFLADLDRA